MNNFTVTRLIRISMKSYNIYFKEIKMNKLISNCQRGFAAKGRSSVSGDLVMAASMGYAGKEVADTHRAHSESLQRLNLYSDERID